MLKSEFIFNLIRIVVQDKVFVLNDIVLVLQRFIVQIVTA